jgi:hypothetical protein
MDTVRERHEGPGVIRLIALDVDGRLNAGGSAEPTGVPFPPPDSAVSRSLATAPLRVPEAGGRPAGRPLTLIVNNGALVKTRGGETSIRHLLPAERRGACWSHRLRDTAVVFDREVRAR